VVIVKKSIDVIVSWFGLFFFYAQIPSSSKCRGIFGIGKPSILNDARLNHYY